MSPDGGKTVLHLNGENSVSLHNLNSSFHLHESSSSPTCNYSMDENTLDTSNSSSSCYTRSYRNFRSNEEYLWAMKEDLADWLNNLYDLNLTADNLIQNLETGVVLCRHANHVISKALSNGHKFEPHANRGANGEIRYRANAKPKTFQARDNVSNFISWCKSLKIHECLLFETDDLVLNKNEKSFILCLLEVTRKCNVLFGIVAPLIVQLEQEIDRELDLDSEVTSPIIPINGLTGPLTNREFAAIETTTDSVTSDESRVSDSIQHCDYYDPHQEELINNLSTSPDSGYMGSLTTTASDQLSLSKDSNNNNHLDKSGKSESQIITNNLKCLHERVVDLLNRCTCPSQFPMVKVADGKYRVGNPKVLIYVRILRNHVMVRVGGGWDTLGHYLDRHDPCRCKLTVNNNQINPNNRPTLNNNNNNHTVHVNSNFYDVHHNHDNHVNTMKPALLTKSPANGSQIWINYNRPYPSTEPQYTSYDNLRCSSSHSLLFNSGLARRDSIGLTESSCSLNSFSGGSSASSSSSTASSTTTSDRQPSRSSQYSDDSLTSTTPSAPSNPDLASNLLHSSKSSSLTSRPLNKPTSTTTISSPSTKSSTIPMSPGLHHHLSTGQLNSLHFDHHHQPHHLSTHQKSHLYKSHHHLHHSTLRLSTLSPQSNNINLNHLRSPFNQPSTKSKSGIAKYIGNNSSLSPRPLTNLSKVNSCTNLRFCHQTPTPPTTTSSPSMKTLQHRKS